MGTRLVSFGSLALLVCGCSVLLVDSECDRPEDCPNATDRCIANACVAQALTDVDGGFLDAAVDSGFDDSGVDTGVDTGVDVCPDGRRLVQGEITEDTEWTSDCIYELTEVIYVVGENVVLDIRPGTRIEGQNGSALVITAGARLRAIGTRDQPVVFTSAQEVGSRRPGDWGGVALLGRAPITARTNIGTEGTPIYVPTSTETLEGLDGDPRGEYGGSDVNHPCGTLEFVRIEFAGFEAIPNNELNGLTLGGCGIDTNLRFVQVHYGLDDGIEFFGGTTFMKNIVISRAQDDSLDWDEGWQGAGQFIIIQQDPPNTAVDARYKGGDNGIEADGLAEDRNAVPRSSPTLYNLTIVGSNIESGRGRAIRMREGTGGQLGNVIMMGHPVSGLDIGDQETSNCALGRVECQDNNLDLQGLILYDLGPGPIGTATTFGEDDGTADDIDENEWLQTRQGLFGVDPLLVDPYDLLDPSFEPISTSPAMTSDAILDLPEDFPNLPENLDEQFDRSLPYFIGAIRNGEDWTEGWTAYPPN